MKRRLILLGLVLSLVLSGCSNKENIKEVVEDVAEDKVVMEKAQEIDYAKDLGDAAVSYFLGQEYDESYGELLDTIRPYAQMSGLKESIYLAYDMNEYIDHVFNNVLRISLILPKEGETVEWAGMTYWQMATAYYEGEITLPDDILDLLIYYGFLNESLTLGMSSYIGNDGFSDSVKSPEEEGFNLVVEGFIDSDEEVLRDLFFPEGVAPAMDAKSDAFRKWFADRSKELNLLDSRIYADDNGEWYLPSSTLGEGAGKQITFFGKTYELSEELVLKTTYSLTDSPVYRMQLDTYTLYDTGNYTATYRTDDSQGVDQVKQIKVNINYTDSEDQEGKTPLETYLNGVTDISVAFEEVTRDKTLNTNSYVASPTDGSLEINPPSDMEDYFKNLAGTAIAYYLGGDYNDAYLEPLIGLPKLASQSRIIDLEKQAWWDTYDYLTISVDYVTHLDIYNGLSEEEQADYYEAYHSGIIAQLRDVIHKDGVVPDMQMRDIDYVPTREYTEWFLQKSKDVGVLDKRIKYTYPNVLSVDSNDCDDSKGGNIINVYGVEFPIPLEDIGVTEDDIKNSPVYKLEETSYGFYDSGYYTASYETKPSKATNQKVAITVTFKYLELTGDYPDALTKFIAGVSDLELGYQD